MKHKEFLDPTAKTEGEHMINQQIMESYQSGVIDHDVEAIRITEE